VANPTSFRSVASKVSNLPVTRQLRKTQEQVHTLAVTDPLKFAAGLGLCVAVLMGSFHAIESLAPGPMPVWEVAVTTQVTCKSGRPALSKSVLLHASLPTPPLKEENSAAKGKIPGARRSPRRVDFSLDQGVTWGLDGGLYLERSKGNRVLLGQVELRKIRCMQPLEQEALGLTSQPSFEVTLPLWMDPSRPVSLTRTPGFACVREGEIGGDSGLIRQAQASDEKAQEPRSGEPIHGSLESSNWRRTTRDRLSFGRGDRALTLRGTNTKRYASWLTCRLGEAREEVPSID
jgi:hypothetical protein